MRALAREEAFLPAGQVDDVELQPLGGMQRHDGHGLVARAAFRVHDQRDMLQEAAEQFVLGDVVDELLEVLEPPRRLGRAVELPHLGVAGFLQDHFGEIDVAASCRSPPTSGAKLFRRSESACRCLAFSSSVSTSSPTAAISGMLRRARVAMDELDGGGAEAALRRVDDALEGEVVGGVHGGAEIGERVADLHALVEARAADDAIVQAERDEALLELAHLEGGAHQDRHLVQRVAAGAAPARCRRRWRALPPRNPSRRRRRPSRPSPPCR